MPKKGQGVFAVGDDGLFGSVMYSQSLMKQCVTHSRQLRHICLEVSQKDKEQYSILMHIYGILKDGNDNPICKTEKETQMYRTDFWTLLEKARVGCSERIALKQVHYQG